MTVVPQKATDNLAINRLEIDPGVFKPDQEVTGDVPVKASGLLRNPFPAAKIDNEGGNDGGDGSQGGAHFGPAQAQDLAAGLLIDCHGTVTPFAVSRAVATHLRATGPCRAARIVSTGAPNHAAMVVLTR